MTFEIKGQQYNLLISFPWEEGIFLRASLMSKNGYTIETWERPISPEVYEKYKMWIAIAKSYMEKITCD